MAFLDVPMDCSLMTLNRVGARLDLADLTVRHKLGNDLIDCSELLANVEL